EVEFERGQARVRLDADDVEPAIVFGGDVTSYVVWALTRTGTPENLGELYVRDDRERVVYTTGQKEFTLLVTAEPYPLVTKPSSLVVFELMPVHARRTRNTPFNYWDWAPAPQVTHQSLNGIRYDGSTPIHLAQARRAFEIAEQRGAEQHAPQLLQEARSAL